MFSNDQFERSPDHNYIFVYIKHPLIEGEVGYYSATDREDLAKISETALALNLSIDLVLSSNLGDVCKNFSEDAFIYVVYPEKLQFLVKAKKKKQ